jgi:hypothetical protein
LAEQQDRRGAWPQQDEQEQQEQQEQQAALVY